MNNPILIHNDNVSESIKKEFESKNIIDFDYLNSNFNKLDEYISKVIIEKLKTTKFDIIFIKNNLSLNYLELYGLRVAYHIRLSQELGEKRFVPIVLLSDLDAYSLNKLEPMARITFTKNVYVATNNLESAKEYSKKKFPKFNKSNYQKDFLDLISIESPENSTSHSIANEWAIEQWAHFLGVKNEEAIVNNRNKISYMLYYKYLKSKYQLENKNVNTNIKPKNYDGNILLIDDKSDDGWYPILYGFCERYYTNVKLDYLENLNAVSDVTSIYKLVEERLGIECPDVILLDLRLLTNEKDEINKISGLQILKHIEDLNPSIQIVMFSASSDSLILDEIHKHNILGYIKKDAPNDKYKTSKNNFNKLDTLIRQGLNRKYLKEIWWYQNKILNSQFFATNRNDEIKALSQSIMTIFEVANSNVSRPFTYSMLSIYKCFELLSDIYIIDDYKNAKWKDNKKIIDQHEDNSTKNYISNIVKHKSSLDLVEIANTLDELVCSRNYAIHTNIKSKCTNITRIEPDTQSLSKYFKEYIIKWYKMLFDIINSIEINNKFNLDGDLK